MKGLSLILVLALALAAAAVVLLSLAVRRQAKRVTALEVEKDELARQIERLALIERREAVCAPLDAVWLCWTRCVPPDEAHLHDAARAAESAKRLFPADMEPDFDEVAYGRRPAPESEVAAARTTWPTIVEAARGATAGASR